MAAAAEEAPLCDVNKVRADCAENQQGGAVAAAAAAQGGSGRVWAGRYLSQCSGTAEPALLVFGNWSLRRWRAAGGCDEAGNGRVSKGGSGQRGATQRLCGSQRERQDAAWFFFIDLAHEAGSPEQKQAKATALGCRGVLP